MAKSQENITHKSPFPAGELKAASGMTKTNPNETSEGVKKQRFHYMYNDTFTEFIWVESPENLTKSHVNNKGADRPAQPHNLISAFIIIPLESRIDKIATRRQGKSAR